MNKERKPNRLNGYDYSTDNLYFITSVVKKRICCLGNIKDGNMNVNEFGKITEEKWNWLADNFPYLILHTFQVMPNHIHGIIEINHTMVAENSPQIKIKSLSELIGAFKMKSSKEIHLAGLKEFEWQRSFHDHIIRDEKSYNKIFDYIINNPLKWEEDKFHKDDI